MAEIASGSIDLKSLKVAGDEASKYITSIDSDGIQVHAQNNTTEHYVQINADGMEVFKDDDSKAFFGETVRIGTEENASITITDSSIVGVGAEGKEFFNFGNSEASGTIRAQQLIANIPLSTVPYGSQEGLTYTINGVPIRSSIDLVLALGASSQTMNFPLGTTTTRSVSFTSPEAITVNATFDGVDTIYKFRLTSRSTSSTHLRGSIFYYKTALTPSYELGGSVSATGMYALAEGQSTEASGDYSHAEGHYGKARGDCSHAEGNSTTASGNYSHAEGYNSIASGNYSHAEGFGAQSSPDSFPELVLLAEGDQSHAEGYVTQALGKASHAQNFYTIAAKQAQTAIGAYNIKDTTATTTHSSGNSAYGEYALIVGNGTSTTRSNALTIDWQGNVMAQGMAGQIIMYAGPIVQSVSNNVITTTAPAGYLLCDGSVVLVDDYPELAAVLGSTYGGDGTTTFGLPDFRGRTGVGVGTGTSSTATEHTLGQTAGSERVTLTKTQIPEFKGSMYVRGYKTSSTSQRAALAHGATGIIDIGAIGSNTANGIMATGVADLGSNPVTISFGGGESHNNMQPYIGINYIIATGKTS